MVLDAIPSEAVWITVDKDALPEHAALINRDQGRMPLAAVPTSATNIRRRGAATG